MAAIRGGRWLQVKSEELYQFGNRLTGGRLAILRLAGERFALLRGAEAAASIAYYAIFSMIPMLLVLIAVVSILLSNLTEPIKIIEFIVESFPIAEQPLTDNILPILEKGSSGGILGLVGLAWAASGVFITLARNVNRAWPGASMRNLIHGRLVGLLMVMAAFILVTAWVLVTSAVRFLPRLQIPIMGSTELYDTLLWLLVSNIIPWTIAFLVFLGIYRWLPNTRVQWREAFWGAAFATVVWELTTRVFTWFLSTRWANYEALYGSLGASVAALFWIYLSAVITLFGAHLSAAVAHEDRLKRRPPDRLRGME